MGNAICYTHAAMKKEIHPQTNNVIFVDTSCGAEFMTTSTLSSEETREVNGEQFFVIRTEISSASHPFYTGKQVLLDTARRIDKFQEKVKKQATAAGSRKGKKAKQAARNAAKKTDDTPVSPVATTATAAPVDATPDTTQEAEA